MTSASRLQHSLMGLAILVVAAAVTWLSFTQQPADAFLFPRLISVAFLALAVWNFLRAFLGYARAGSGLSTGVMLRILPGLIVACAFIYFAAKQFGFYVTSTVAFLVIYSLYDPAPFNSLRDWLKRIVITAIFMGIIYALFALLLQVQTPRGQFF